jgi:hypothetical protein
MKPEERKLVQYVILIGAAYFLVINPLLKKLGISKDPQSKLIDDLDKVAPAKSIWSGAGYVAPAGARLLTSKDALKFAIQIYDALNNRLSGDDEATVIGIFRGLKSQSQVASIAKAFQSKYKLDLLTTLKNGTPTAQFWRAISAGLSVDELNQILSIIKSKPIK